MVDRHTKVPIAADLMLDENACEEPSFSDSEYNYVDSASDEGLSSFLNQCSVTG